jgi:hypothetical protein
LIHCRARSWTIPSDAPLRIESSGEPDHSFWIAWVRGISTNAEQARCSEPGDGALVDNRRSLAPGH